MELYFVHYVGYHIDILVSKKIKQGKIKKKEYRYRYFKQLLFKIFIQKKAHLVLTRTHHEEASYIMSHCPSATQEIVSYDPRNLNRHPS